VRADCLPAVLKPLRDGRQASAGGTGLAMTIWIGLEKWDVDHETCSLKFLPRMHELKTNREEELHEWNSCQLVEFVFNSPFVLKLEN
jgi:hypothetical protein